MVRSISATILFSLFFIPPFTTSGQCESHSSLSLDLDRTAYYRGEEILVVVEVQCAVTENEETLKVSLHADNILLASASLDWITPSTKTSLRLRFDSNLLRVGEYALEGWLSKSESIVAKASREIALAKRPNPERLMVWLWGGGGNQWYRDHGFTTWNGAYWRPDGVEFKSSTREYIEKGLLAGADVGLTANGGLANIDPAQFEDPYAAHQNVRETKKGTIANPFHPEVARVHEKINERLMKFSSRFPQIRTAFFNTEVVDDLRIENNPEGSKRLKDVLGLTEEDAEETQWVAPGVIADDDPKYLLHKYRYKEGSGLALANRRTSEIIHRYRPDILTINDPFRETSLYDLFPGMDVISTWTYTNPDPKLMLYIESLRAACKPTNQTPLHTVTLLNYPGELAPTEEWMLMGPGRAKVATWINLSRAPKMIGYYYSSVCNPQKGDTFETPYSTSEAIQELSEKVFEPFGPLLRNLNVTPRRVAVLSSAAAGLYSKSPRLRGGYANLQPYHFYTLLAMAHYQADIVFDETIERYGLKDYDVLVLPKCDVLTESVYKEIEIFQSRGGVVLSDQYLGPNIPGAIPFDFDFTYRKKVNAQAISQNSVYAEWNDHIEPASAELEVVEGVTALDDQRIMESYAERLKERMGKILQPEVTCDRPTVLFNLLEKGDSKFLVVINDFRTYDDRVGQYKSVLGKVLPQSATLKLRDWKAPELFVYDLMRGEAVSVTHGSSGWEIPIDLTEIGGTILSIRSSPIIGLEIDAQDEVQIGKSARIDVCVRQGTGTPAEGALPIQVQMIDPEGREHELSDYYCAEEGHLPLDFEVAKNDPTGEWKIKVVDLTSRNTVTKVIRVTH